jgi:hypothetical protein
LKYDQLNERYRETNLRLQAKVGIFLGLFRCTRIHVNPRVLQWIEVKFNFHPNPLQHTWIEVDTLIQTSPGCFYQRATNNLPELVNGYHLPLLRFLHEFTSSFIEGTVKPSYFTSIVLNGSHVHFAPSSIFLFRMQKYIKIHAPHRQSNKEPELKKKCQKLCISYEPMIIATIIRICRGGAKIHGRDVRTKIIMSKKKVVA